MVPVCIVVQRTAITIIQFYIQFRFKEKDKK